MSDGIHFWSRSLATMTYPFAVFFCPFFAIAWVVGGDEGDSRWPVSSQIFVLVSPINQKFRREHAPRSRVPERRTGERNTPESLGRFAAFGCRRRRWQSTSEGATPVLTKASHSTLSHSPDTLPSPCQTSRTSQMGSMVPLFMTKKKRSISQTSNKSA